MDLNLKEWVSLFVRWTHVFAAILWVGATYFFTWLDGRFTELSRKPVTPEGSSANEVPSSPAPAPASGQQVWMVHSGGFYRVVREKNPSAMPDKLHWFRWEAAITWLSGVLLFLLLYYHGGLMVGLEDPPISQAWAVALSVGLLLVSWPVYDLLWFRFLTNEAAAVIISFGLVAGLAFWLTRWFTGRAAYLQIGGMFGTIMAANVWMRILPAQRRMVAALQAGLGPNQTEALKAKACSKHNTFIVVPTVFLMISNHFPTITYGHRWSWLILSALVLLGWAAARVLRRA